MAASKRDSTRLKTKAMSEDVLCDAVERFFVSPKWQKHYARLIELRQSLLQRKAELAKDALSEQPAFSTHMADAGTDTYDRDFTLGVLSSDQDAIYQVDQAIDRIRTGVYGICELSGKRIEQARLEAVPWTRFSSAAEKKLEREGTFKRAGLGPRETVGRTVAAKRDGTTA